MNDRTGWQLILGTDVSTLAVDDRELRQDRDAAIRTSETDELTQISNRRHIMAQLEQAIVEALDRRGSVGSACLLDIDHFKAVNDCYGHLVGDQVLQAFASYARGLIRMRDGFGRVGGEEFLLVMPGLVQSRAAAIAERIVAGLRDARLVPDQPDLVVTASIGLTQIVPQDRTDDVFRRCDEALYRAKSNGRDQVQLSG